MNITDIKIMVVTTKTTKDWTGKQAYLVPNGKCTNSLSYVTELWCKELNVPFSRLEYNKN